LFSLSFYNPTEVDGLRDIKSGKIGKLMAIVGTITKTTEVRPELLIGGFSCAVCGAKVKDIEQ
jgi:DNA replication licensing factor MCM6